MKSKRNAKKNTTFRLSIEAKELLRRLADKISISQTDKLEIMIRQEAWREKIEVDVSLNEFGDGYTHI